MKSLVVKEISTQLNDNGTELELDTSQFKAECEYIVKKEVTISSVKVTIDKDTFKTKMGGTLSNSYYYFQRVDNKWNMYGGAEDVDLSEYGITLDGEVNEDDRLYVYCDTVNNVVTSTEYNQYLMIYSGAEKEYFNYVSLFCLVPNVRFMVGYIQSGVGEMSIYSEMSMKSENLLYSDYSQAIIRVTTKGYYDTATIKIIVAKVIR